MSKPTLAPKTEFDPALHRYTLNGRIIPHVSLILAATGIAPDWRKVDPIILANKRSLGSALHKCLHYLQENDLDPESVDDSVKPYLGGYGLFVKDSGFKPTAVEVRRWPVLNLLPYGMTADVIGTIRGDLWLLDFKTTEGAPHPSWRLQTAAYGYGAWPPITPPFHYRRASLQLFPNGQYHFKEWTHRGDLDEFTWALALVWRRINRGEKLWETTK